MSLSSKKQLAKKEFQKYVRMRDADEHGYCTCCTCGKRLHWKEIDGGHFVPAERLATCFIDENCNPQCTYCNKWQYGRLDEYFVYMEKRYGRAVIDSLLKQKWDQVKLKEANYIELIKSFRAKQKQMMKEKSL